MDLFTSQIDIKMDIRMVYTSVSCNRTPTSADWGVENNRIAFGACNSVGIFDPKVCYEFQSH